ncbi:uncharacterized protein [Lolium perenne]|uniref:uncharacterized protein isoform X2 n=1 Tax=Lolium perenne TaxID=4522 RepID=UPI0021F5DBA1|nr:uncharacterized protein LOC127295632 isoform X2 [Lolium perenne]
MSHVRPVTRRRGKIQNYHQPVRLSQSAQTMKNLAAAIMVAKPTANPISRAIPIDAEPMAERNPINCYPDELPDDPCPTQGLCERSPVLRSESTPAPRVSESSAISEKGQSGGDKNEIDSHGSAIPQIGWKTRKKALSGPDSRSSPSSISAVDACIMKAEGNRGLDIFAPVVGMTFDSCQEAYDLYNLFSWEHGFGIRHSRSRINTNGYRLMHDLVCQCEGKSEKENSSTCKTDCKAKVRLLRTDDHGWYVSMFLNDHNHPMSSRCDEKRQWNSRCAAKQQQLPMTEKWRSEACICTHVSRTRQIQICQPLHYSALWT